MAKFSGEIRSPEVNTSMSGNALTSWPLGLAAMDFFPLLKVDTSCPDFNNSEKHSPIIWLLRLAGTGFFPRSQ